MDVSSVKDIDMKITKMGFSLKFFLEYFTLPRFPYYLLPVSCRVDIDFKDKTIDQVLGGIRPQSTCTALRAPLSAVTYSAG